MSDLIITDELTIPWSEVTLSFARSSGPGGQNVNKVESKVELRWNPADSAAVAGLPAGDRAWLLDRLTGRLTVSGDLLVTSQRTRDQGKNREDAAAKLVEIVRAALARPRRRKATRPSRGSRERRIQAKKHRAGIKKGRRSPADEH